MSSIKKLLFSMGCLLTHGCGQTPVHLDAHNLSESAVVYFYSAPGIQSSAWAIDGVQQGIFDMGLRVGAGEHRATNEFQFDTENCHWGDTLCFDVTSYGRCSANFSASPGGDYAVRISRAGDSVFVSVEDKKSGESAGQGSCSILHSSSRTSRATLRTH